MKLKLLILSSLLVSFSLFLHASPTNDSLAKLETKFSNFEKQQKTTSDSLQRELQYYKVKEDFFNSALDEQSTRFALIIATILGFVGLISFGSIKLEIYRLKKEYQKEVKSVKNELQEYKKRVTKNESSLNITTGNTLAHIGLMFLDRKDYISSFEAYLASARAFSKTGKLILNNEVEPRKDPPFKYAITNMKSASDALKEAIKFPKNIDIMKENLQHYSEMIETIMETKDTTLIDLSSECRITIKNFIGEK